MAAGGRFWIGGEGNVSLFAFMRRLGRIDDDSMHYYSYSIIVYIVTRYFFSTALLLFITRYELTRCGPDGLPYYDDTPTPSHYQDKGPTSRHIFR